MTPKFLKTLKIQLAIAAALALPIMAAPTPSLATGANYCECVAILCGDGADGCMDYCAMIHMQTLCAKDASNLVWDRR